MNTCKRILAFALALIMILSYLPAQHIHVSATEEETVTESTPTEAPTGESTEEPTEEPTDASAEESVENGIVLNEELTVTIDNGGQIVYIPFTPTQTDRYTFRSSAPEGVDTYGYIYDKDMNQLYSNDDEGEYNNFSIDYVLQADTLYYLGARFYDSAKTGSFPVRLIQAHDYFFSTNGSPTCVTPAETIYTCAYCRYSFAEPYYDDHTWNDGEVIKEASCTAPGSIVYTCTTEGCGQTRTEEVTVDHSFVDGVCSVCGLLEGVLQLDVPYTVKIDEPGKVVYLRFTPDQTERYYFYSYDSENDPFGVLYDDTMSTLFENDQIGDYNNFGIEYTLEAGRTYYLAAQECDSSVTSSYAVQVNIAHDYSSEETRPGTCTEPGERTYTCIHCGDSFTETTEPSHSFENGQCTGCDEVQILEECFGYYENDDGTITISGYYGSFYDVTVPSQMDGKTVTALGYGAFSGSGQLKSVTIPEGITSLDEYCFAGCGALESVHLPGTLTSIGGYAFQDCHRLKQINIPDSVTSLGYNLFLNCYDLETATIGSGVTVLPAGLFSSCNALETIYLGANITEIQSLAFANCYALHHIFFEGSEEDWSNIFIESEGNERLFNGYITVHCDTDGASVLTTREDCTSIYTDCSLCNAVVKQTPKDIPSHQMGEDGICTLCGHQEGVLQLDMPYTAFISQPGEVITLEFSAPASESYSFKVETQETLRYTMKWNYNEQTDPCWPSEYNFGAIFNAGDVVQLQFSYQDSNMTGSFRITPYISHQMYGEQTKDPTCTEPGEMIHRCSYCDYSYTTIIEPSHNYENGVCTACGDQQILEDCFHYEDNGDGTVTIMDYSGSFYDVVIPSQLGGMPVVAINNYAMDYNSNLQSVTVPEGVTRLGYGAFYSCYNLETVNLPSTLTSLDGEIFSWCYKLKNVNLPDNITTMGYGVFYECHALESIDLPAGLTQISNCLFYNCDNLQSITIPEGITSIGSNAFYSCDDLGYVVLGSDVNYIDGGAFVDCSNLYHVFYAGTQEDRSNINFTNDNLNLTGVTWHYEAADASVLENRGDCTTSTIYCGLCDATIKSFPKDVPTHDYGADGVCTICGHRDGYITPDSFTVVNVEYPGQTVELLFTPEYTHPYYFCSIAGGADTWGAIYNHATAEQLISNDDDGGLDFGMEFILEAGVTYRLVARYLGDGTVGSFPVNLESLHEFNQEVEDPKATCTTDGLLTVSCQYCDEGYTEVVPAGHKFIDGVCVRGCGATQTLMDCLTYELHPDYPNHMVITGYTGSFKHVELPAEIDGVPVITITGGTFSGNEYLESIVIPEGVEYVGYNGFSDCPNLSSVTLPQSLTGISDGLFYNCPALKSINIPNNVTWIGWDSFSSSGLERITIPATVTELGYGAFRNCRSLQSVTLNEGLAMIGQSAFDNCRSLESIEIPDSVTNIGCYAFADCQDLQSIAIPEGITNIYEGTFYNCYDLQTVVLPSTLTNVEWRAFQGPWNLKHVLFRGTDDQWNAINFASENWILQEVTRHTGCTGNELSVTTSCVGSIFSCSVCGGSFSTETTENTPHQFDANRICTICGAPEHLQYQIYNGEAQIIWYSNGDDTQPPQDVVIPETIAGFPVGTIRHGVFLGNSFVGSVSIPKTVHEIAYSVFSQNENLTAITVDTASPYYCVVNNVLYSKDMTQLHTAVPTLSGSFTVPATVESILPSAFYGSKISEIILPQGLSYIGPQAFQNCRLITEVVLPDSVTQLGGSAFGDCEKLEEVTIPKTANITSLTYCTFSNCTALKSVTLPDSLTSIEWMAFYECSSLESIDIPDSVTNLQIEAFYNCSSLQSIDLPSSLNYMEDQVFFNCSSLTSVALPTNVVYISYGAFMNCSSLQTVTLPQNLGGIWESAFQGCSSLNTVDVPAGVHRIGWLAFADCGNNLEISFIGDAPASGGEVFRGTEGNAYYPADNATWTQQVMQDFGGSITWCPYNITFPITGSNESGTITWELVSDGTLTVSGSGEMDHTINWNSYKYLVKSLVIEDGITYVHDEALDSYPELTTMYFGKDVANIGWYDLNCGKMTAYVVDPANTAYASVDGVLFTKDMATLLRCPTGYTGSYTVPTGVTTISWSAFALCEGITEIIIPDTVESIEVLAFGGTSITEIIIPASVTNLSTSAFGAKWVLMGDPYCSNCDLLTEINVDEHNPNYASVDGVLYNKDLTALLRCPGGYSGSFTIPNGVDSIGTIAFNECSKLTDITIPEGVTSIGTGGDATFAGCTSLTALTFPASVADYGFALFARNPNLQEVHFDGIAPSSNMVFVGVKSDLTVFFPEGDSSWEDLITMVEDEIPANPNWANIHFEPVGNGGNEDPDQPDLPGQANPFVTTCPDSTADLLHICEHNFPDENFRNYVLEYGGDGNVDGNKDGYLTREEAACVRTIACEWWDIYSMEGIQHFTNLIDLWCAENHLTQLDLSGNPNLRILEARCNSFTSIDLSVCPDLEFINVDLNPITTLDVSMLPNLTDLYCSNTKITAIDVSQNPQLRTFCCSDSSIPSVDLSNNPLIDHLNIGGNGWDMDLSVLPELRVLYCYNNGLTQLDLSGNPKIQELHCNDNPNLDTLIVGNTDLSQLTWLDYSYTDLTFDISTMPNLEVLRCAGHNLTSIDLSKNTAIRELSVNDNDLTELDVSMLADLEILDCNENNISSLDLSSNTNLRELICFHTGLTELKVAGLSNLMMLDCAENRLGHLDLSGCTSLDGIHAINAGLTSIDITGCDNLMSLMADEQWVSATISSTQQGSQYLVDMADFVDSKYLANIDIVYDATYNASTGIATFSQIPYDIHYTYDMNYAQDPSYRMNVFISNDCNHDWDETCTSRTCRFCGTTETIDNHHWTSATCQQPTTCERCGATTGTVRNHKYGHWITTTVPTTSAEGERTRTCIWCSDAQSKSIPQLPSHGKLIENTTDPEQNDCGAALAAADGTLENAVLTEEDTANSSLITISLTTQQVENRDLPEEDMVALDQSFEELVINTTEEKGEIQNADYIHLDIDLHKQLDDNEPEQVHETNAPVEITITVPEHMRDPEPGHNRDYHIIRVHNGEPQFLDHTHDIENHKISFHTDRFSTYTLVYVDTLDENAEEPVYVAAVGGDHYETLGEAIMNAANGDTVTLLADITRYEGGTQMIERPVTIDLAGKALNVLDEEGTTSYYGIVVFSELTIIDSSKNQSGSVNAGFINLSYTGILNIESGFINAEISDESEGCTINLSGGTYAARPKNEWCVEGKTVVENNYDTYCTYSVVDIVAEEPVYVAEVDGQEYEYLGEAIMNAGENSVVTLLQDITQCEGGTLMVERSVTVDLAGHALNVLDEAGSTSYYGIVVFGELTIIDSSNEQTGSVNAGFINISSYGTLNIEAGFIDAEISDEADGCVINLSGGTYAARPKDEWCAEGKMIVENNLDTHCTYSVVDEIVKFDFAGSTMTLGNELVLNFVYNKALLTGTDNYAKVTIAREGGDYTYEIPQSEWTTFNTAMNQIPVKVFAKEMTDEITVVICNAAGQEVSNPRTGSVVAYCNNLFEKSNVQKDKAMAVDMLNYGAAAQIQFNYREETLANAGLTDELKALATQVTDMQDASSKGPGCAGNTLTLEDKILLNFVYQNATIDKAAYATVSYVDHYGVAVNYNIEAADFLTFNSSMKMVQINTLVISDCRTMVSVELFDADGNSLGVSKTSVESYTARSGQELFKAILAFGDSAYAKFH